MVNSTLITILLFLASLEANGQFLEVNSINDVKSAEITDSYIVCNNFQKVTDFIIQNVPKLRNLEVYNAKEIYIDSNIASFDTIYNLKLGKVKNPEILNSLKTIYDLSYSITETKDTSFVTTKGLMYLTLEGNIDSISKFNYLQWDSLMFLKITSRSFKLTNAILSLPKLTDLRGNFNIFSDINSSIVSNLKTTVVSIENVNFKKVPLQSLSRFLTFTGKVEFINCQFSKSQVSKLKDFNQQRGKEIFVGVVIKSCGNKTSIKYW